MAPNKEFPSVNSRFCCDVLNSKCILGDQTKAPQNLWFEILNMLELLHVPKASPRCPAKSQLIMRSPSQIAWPWELVKSGFTNMQLFPPARTPGGYPLSDQRIWMPFCSPKLSSWAVYHRKDANYFHFCTSVEIFTLCCYSKDPISSRIGCIRCALGMILSI